MFLYFIEAGDAIKVGVATNVENRLSTIQTGNPKEIKLIHSVDLPEEEAPEMEKEIHRLFYRTNLRGEWFQANQFMYRYIENIKMNGISSRFEWIKKEYENTYDKILKGLERTIENDITQGNLISLDMLKDSLDRLIDSVSPTIFFEVSEGITTAVKDWLQKARPGAFTLKHIYRDLGIHKRKDKHNVVVALSRIVETSKVIDKVSSGRFIKIIDIDIKDLHRVSQ